MLEQVGSTYVPSDPHKWGYKGRPMTLAVDYDGTCVESKWPEPVVTREGCISVLKTLLDKGHRIIIWTCRELGHESKHGEHSGINETMRWIYDNGLDKYLDVQLRVNRNFQSWIDDMGCDSRKVFAHVYIDDRNLGGFPGWDKVLEMLGIEA